MNVTLNKGSKECQIDIGNSALTTIRQVEIVEEVVNELPEKSKPEGRFDAWHKLPAQTKGKAAALIIAKFFALAGIDIEKFDGYSRARMIKNSIVTIKSSGPWGNGIFKFQQIRSSDECDGLLLIAIDFDHIYLWYIPNKDLEHFRIAKLLTPQQAQGKQSEWLTVTLNEPLLTPYGGLLNKETLSKVVSLIE